jgi:Flp pilus assembly protein TadD/pyruvate-formate lyase-activating enzyme
MATRSLNVDQALQQALSHHQADRPQEAGGANQPSEVQRREANAAPTAAEIGDGMTLFNKGCYAELEPIARELTLRFPLHAFGWQLLGAVLSQLARPDEALTPMQKAAALLPLDAEPHFNLGIALLAEGRLSEAEGSLRRALELKPDLATAHYNLGITLIDQGRLAEAEAMLRKAVAAEPTNLMFRRKLCGVLGILGKSVEGFLPDYLAPEVFDHANGRVLRRYFPVEADTFLYAIDIAGTCNLRCPSCPVGNFSDAVRPKGLMNLDLFRAIVRKIRQDNVVGNPKIWLFNWGEPMLHPRLPEIIAILRENGLQAMISSNLNTEKGLKEVIRAAPDELKISLSAFSPEIYSRTHVRGDINLVRANMHLVRHFMDKFSSPIRVWVGHHIYSDNTHEAEAIKNLCSVLGFEYQAIQAFYQPIEKMVDLVEGRIPASEAGILASFPVHPLDALAQKRKHIDRKLDCELRFNMMTINFDGNVALCCGVYDLRNMLGVNFLDASHDDIQALKYRHQFCKKCFDNGLQYSPAPVSQFVFQQSNW